MKVTDKKCLIAYFSRKGQNYVSGKIVDLKVGNTEVVANMIQEIAGGDMFHIESATAYPKDYKETTEIAKNELRAKARPKLTGRVENMKTYDVIFLGYPNWWGTMPMPVYTFLESYDFSGKKIVPFCTHEGSGMGNSEKDIAKVCPKATVLEGIEIHGTSAGSAESKVSSWIDKLSISLCGDDSIVGFGTRVRDSCQGLVGIVLNTPCRVASDIFIPIRQRNARCSGCRSCTSLGSKDVGSGSNPSDITHRFDERCLPITCIERLSRQMPCLSPKSSPRRNVSAPKSIAGPAFYPRRSSTPNENSRRMALWDGPDPSKSGMFIWTIVVRYTLKNDVSPSVIWCCLPRIFHEGQSRRRTCNEESKRLQLSLQSLLSVWF